MPLIRKTSPTPAISVIVPSYNSRATVSRCLAALTAQDCTEDYEILLVDSSDDCTPELVQADFPGVRLIRFPKKTLPGLARNRGAAEAQGSILVFTDADCVPPRHWIRRHVALQEKWDVVGGSVRNGNPRSLIGWASYLLEFSEFTPGSRRANSRNLVTANVSYKKRIFETDGFPEDIFPGEDFVFHRRLSENLDCYLDRSLTVDHLNRTTIQEFLQHQRRLAIASVAVRQRVDVRGRILLRIPLLVCMAPVIRLLLLVSRLLRNTPSLFPIAVMLSPLLLMGVVWWSSCFYTEARRIDRDRNRNPKELGRVKSSE